MRTGKIMRTLAAALALLPAVMTAGCNDFSTSEGDLPMATTSTLILNTIPAKNCDLSHVRKIRMYNYCCDSGWANQPCTLTLYERRLKADGGWYRPSSTYEDIFFEDLPIENFGIDAWGNSIVWTDSDTGNYSGAAKEFQLSRNLDIGAFPENGRLVLSYTLDVPGGIKAGDGIQIVFVDKDGNESDYVYYLAEYPAS